MTVHGPSRFAKLTLMSLLALVAALSVVTWQLISGPPIPETDVAVAEDPKPAATPRPSALAVTMPAAGPRAYTEILARPLFDPSRRPPVAPKAAAAPPPPPPATTPFPSEKFRLVGIISIPNHAPLALIRTDSQKPAISVAVGGAIDGWHVEKIGDDYVDFKKSNSTGKLKLVTQTAGPSTAAAAKTKAAGQPETKTPDATNRAPIAPAPSAQRPPDSGAVRK
jgi:hypothetical protein